MSVADAACHARQQASRLRYRLISVLRNLGVHVPRPRQNTPGEIEFRGESVSLEEARDLEAAAAGAADDDRRGTMVESAEPFGYLTHADVHVLRGHRGQLGLPILAHVQQDQLLSCGAPLQEFPGTQ